MGAMSVTMRWSLLATLVAVLGGAPRAQAFEAADGAIQGHGFGEMQLSAIGNDFDASDDWDLAQWWNVFNLELEWDAAPDGIGPFDYVSFYSRIEVRYDCVWNRGCGMLPKANAFGDRSRHLPKRLVNAISSDIS